MTAPRARTRTSRGAVPLAVPWSVRDLGRIGYREAWALQKEIVAARHAGEVPDTLLVCEHEAVVTTGRGTPDGAVLDSRFPVEAVERGGEATYHGPGQVVVYPIVLLAPGARDLHRWLRALEEACIETLGVFGLACGRRSGATGVWLGDAGGSERKIVSIGVAANRWVSWHGLALNHETQLEDFSVIRPCGFDAAVMTSMAAELGDRCPSRAGVLAELVPALERHLAGFREDPTEATP
jgi:lipoyl(octanoyl) transferase